MYELAIKKGYFELIIEYQKSAVRYQIKQTNKLNSHVEHAIN